MRTVVALLGTGEGGGGEWHVRKEAAWVVSNVAAVGTLGHCAALLELGVVGPLTHVLASSRDNRILSVVLDAVEALLSMRQKAGNNTRDVHDMFEAVGLLDALENVQRDAPDDVYEKCVGVLKKHFPLEEDDEEAENWYGINNNNNNNLSVQHQQQTSMRINGSNGTTGNSEPQSSQLDCGFNSSTLSSSGASLGHSQLPISATSSQQFGFPPLSSSSTNNCLPTFGITGVSTAANATNVCGFPPLQPTHFSFSEMTFT